MHRGFFFFFFFWLHLSNSICYVIQSLSPVCLFGTRWTTARQASLFFTISQSLLKLKSIELVGDAIQPSHPLLSPSPPAFQSFPASGSFPMSWLCISGGQSIGASASVFPMNIQDWFPLGLSGLIYLQYNRLSRVFSSITVQKHQFFGALSFLWSNSHIRSCYWKDQASTIRTFVSK